MIRDEKIQDYLTVFEINKSAFESEAEARLVAELREKAEPCISLVFEDDGEVLGHILFSPVTVDGLNDKLVMGLAPMAVIPGRQREGVGSLLILEGIRRCREIGCGAIVVLGHTKYYPKFGFQPSTHFGFKSEYNVPEEAFMVVELESGYLKGAFGFARYHKAFGEL